MISDRIFAKGVTFMLTGDLPRAAACLRVGRLVQRLERVIGFTVPGFALGYIIGAGAWPLS